MRVRLEKKRVFVRSRLNLFVFELLCVQPICFSTFRFTFLRSSQPAPRYSPFAGLAPESLLAAIFRGQAQRAVAPIVIVGFLGAKPRMGCSPYCICMFYYYYYSSSSSSWPMGVYGSPMNGTYENDEIWQLVEMA